MYVDDRLINQALKYLSGIIVYSSNTFNCIKLLSAL